MAENALVPVERIEKAILLVRGQEVMLDSDLAELYGVETKGAEQGRQAQPDPVSSGFPVPADGRGGRIFEVPIWDLKAGGPGQAAIPALRLHRAGGGDAVERPAQRDGRRGQHRH